MRKPRLESPSPGRAERRAQRPAIALHRPKAHCHRASTCYLNHWATTHTNAISPALAAWLESAHRQSSAQIGLDCRARWHGRAEYPASLPLYPGAARLFLRLAMASHPDRSCHPSARINARAAVSGLSCHCRCAPTGQELCQAPTKTRYLAAPARVRRWSLPPRCPLRHRLPR